jgi:hypothetical protein
MRALVWVLILLRLYRHPLRTRRLCTRIHPPTERLGYRMGYILGITTSRIIRIVRYKISTEQQHKHHHHHLGTKDMLNIGMSAYGMYADVDPIERSIGEDEGGWVF